MDKARADLAAKQPQAPPPPVVSSTAPTTKAAAAAPPAAKQSATKTSTIKNSKSTDQIAAKQHVSYISSPIFLRK